MNNDQEIQSFVTNGPDPFDMDQAFCDRMRAAIAAGWKVRRLVSSPRLERETPDTFQQTNSSARMKPRPGAPVHSEPGRTSVSSISVTLITPGAGCSITSRATVSISGATGCSLRSFRAAFFAGAGLGLALAVLLFIGFAALDTLRGLPRLAEFALRTFARFCTFDAFLRLAMIDPCSGWWLGKTH